MIIRRHFSRLYRNAENTEPGSGFTPSSDAPDASTVADPAAAAPTEQPKTMLEAMFGDEQTADPAVEGGAGPNRDAQGRFAPKAGELGPDGKPLAAAPAVPAAPKPEKERPEDLRVMPEGLAPKAQERFQKLVNSNKEFEGQMAQMRSVIEPFREILQENAVQEPQFRQAMDVVGMINRGDLAGAQTVLEEQLRLISLATGKPIGTVDALSKYPDLREAVDNLQITEANAMEIARARATTAGQQQQRQRQQDEQQRTSAAQEAHHNATVSVDEFCKEKMASDLDYPKIEALLLAEINNGLLNDVPPSAWRNVVEKTYGLIKQSASMTRTQSSGAPTLRPSGANQAAQKPTNAYEAMWGEARPAT